MRTIGMVLPKGAEQGPGRPSEEKQSKETKNKPAVTSKEEKSEGK